MAKQIFVGSQALCCHIATVSWVTCRSCKQRGVELQASWANGNCSDHASRTGQRRVTTGRRSQVAEHLVLCIALHRMGPDASRRRGDNRVLERDVEPPGAKPQPDSLHLSPPRAPCCQHQHRMGPYSSIKLNCKHGGQVATAQRDVEATWCTYNHI